MAFDLATARPVGFDVSTAKPVDDDFSFSEMVSNIPSSAKTLVSNVATAVTHPVQTAKGLKGVAEGVAQHTADALEIPQSAKGVVPFMAPLFSWLSSGDEDKRPYADAVVQGIKDRYGSVANAKKTLEQDPVGVLVDVASVVSGTGALKTGSAINPINVTKGAAKVAAKSVIPKSAPARMYESVAKFSTTLPKAQREAMISTALKYGLNPSNKGVDKLASIIKSFDDKIDDLIRASDDAGKTIPRQSVYKHLGDLRRQKGGFKFGAPDDLKAIDRMVGDFEKYAKRLLPDRVTAGQLQQFKRDLYDSINWDAKRLTGTPIKEATYKSVARGAKEGVEQLVPEVGPTNKAMGELLELQPALQRAANRIENRNLIGLQAPVEVGAGAAAGQALGVPAVGGAIGTVAAILGIPKLKAANAIRLQRLIDSGYVEAYLRNNPAVSAAELLTILGGRATESGLQDTQQPETQ